MSTTDSATTHSPQKTHTKRWVIKIGSALLTNNGIGLAHNSLKKWIEQLAALKQQGHEIVIVSSGSVAEGMARLGWKKRPNTLHEQQAAAAVGQMGLIQAYEMHFQTHNLHTAQILLVHDDLSSRTRYLNARQTLQSLIELGVIPIINENDTIATEEIRFGDNDSLAGLVANIIDADHLVILTDQHGIFDSDPRKNADAKLIKECDAHDSLLDQAASGTSGQLGRGGMITKIRAARLAARSGTSTIIAHGLEDNIIHRLACGEHLGTKLTTTRKPITARKQWLSGSVRSKGTLTLDEGAIKVLRKDGKSLLPIGVKSVSGYFKRGELVICVDESGKEVAKGLVNYNVHETKKIIGQKSGQLVELLGYQGEEELIHRDDLVLL